MRLRSLALALAIAAASATVSAGPAVAGTGPTGLTSSVTMQEYPSRAVQAVVRRATPLYPESPDSWECHFGGDCRASGVRDAGDPPRIDTLDRGTVVWIRCQFGHHATVEVEPGRTETGWIGVDDLNYNAEPDTCGLADWAWGWQRWF